MEFDGFDWDHGNEDKCRKHGVSIAEIESLFDRTIFVGPDLAHSASEQRLRAVGHDFTRPMGVPRVHLAHQEWPPPGEADQRAIHAQEGNWVP